MNKERIMKLDFVNQSLIKKFYHKGNEVPHCPRKIIDADFIETESMTKGKYFETHLLGSSAKGDAVYDLPRRKLTKKQIAQNIINEREGKPLIIGDKLTDQKRIDIQIERAKKLIAKHQITIAPGINTQVPVFKRWEQDPNIILRGEFDIFPTGLWSRKFNKYLLAAIDLKLTAKLDSTWGKYCYGAPEHLDEIQGIFYQYALYDLDFELNPHLKELINQGMVDRFREELRFYLWVFNYATDDLDDKFFQIVYTKAKEYELFESIRKTLSIIEKYNNEGWQPVPDGDECRNCPLADNCSSNYYGI